MLWTTNEHSHTHREDTHNTRMLLNVLASAMLAVMALTGHHVRAVPVNTNALVQRDEPSFNGVTCMSSIDEAAWWISNIQQHIAPGELYDDNAKRLFYEFIACSSKPTRRMTKQEVVDKIRPIVRSDSVLLVDSEARHVFHNENGYDPNLHVLPITNLQRTDYFDPRIHPAILLQPLLAVPHFNQSSDRFPTRTLGYYRFPRTLYLENKVYHFAASISSQNWPIDKLSSSDSLSIIYQFVELMRWLWDNELDIRSDVGLAKGCISFLLYREDEGKTEHLTMISLLNIGECLVKAPFNVGNHPRTRGVFTLMLKLVERLDSFKAEDEDRIRSMLVALYGIDERTSVQRFIVNLLRDYVNRGVAHVFNDNAWDRMIAKLKNAPYLENLPGGTVRSSRRTLGYLNGTEYEDERIFNIHSTTNFQIDAMRAGLIFNRNTGDFAISPLLVKKTFTYVSHLNQFSKSYANYEHFKAILGAPFLSHVYIRTIDNGFAEVYYVGEGVEELQISQSLRKQSWVKEYHRIAQIVVSQMERNVYYHVHKTPIIVLNDRLYLRLNPVNNHSPLESLRDKYPEDEKKIMKQSVLSMLVLQMLTYRGYNLRSPFPDGFAEFFIRDIMRSYTQDYRNTLGYKILEAIAPTDIEIDFLTLIFFDHSVDIDERISMFFGHPVWALLDTKAAEGDTLLACQEINGLDTEDMIVRKLELCQTHFYSNQWHRHLELEEKGYDFPITNVDYFLEYKRRYEAYLKINDGTSWAIDTMDPESYIANNSIVEFHCNLAMYLGTYDVLMSRYKEHGLTLLPPTIFEPYRLDLVIMDVEYSELPPYAVNISKFNMNMNIADDIPGIILSTMFGYRIQIDQNQRLKMSFINFICHTSYEVDEDDICRDKVASRMPHFFNPDVDVNDFYTLVLEYHSLFSEEDEGEEMLDTPQIYADAIAEVKAFVVSRGLAAVAKYSETSARSQETTECIVCYDEFKADSPVLTQKCNHLMCRTCALSIIEIAQEQRTIFSCPLCRLHELIF